MQIVAREVFPENVESEKKIINLWSKSHVWWAIILIEIVPSNEQRERKINGSLLDGGK